MRDFAKLASPLNALTRKHVKFKWTDSCQQAFDTLKTALTNAPILAFPQFDKPFLVQVDASDSGIVMVLSQIQDGREVAIAYAGRDLNPTERNYSATEREALAVIAAIKKLQPVMQCPPFYRPSLSQCKTAALKRCRFLLPNERLWLKRPSRTK